MATVKKDGTVYIGTEIDSSDLENVEKDYKKAVSKIGENIKKVFSDAKEQIGNFAQLTNKVITGIEKAFEGVKTAAGKFGDVARKIGTTIKNGFSIAKDAASKFGDVAGKVASAVGSAFTAMTKVISAAGSAIGAIVGMGVSYNSQMEDYMANFSVMLGDAEAAGEHVDALKELAAKTPFEMGSLAETTQTLLAFNSTAEESIDQTRMLGDIALGNEQKLGTLATAFGRIQSNGRASMEEINMMIDSGFNPLNIIAEETGESMDELRKRVSEGGVSFEEIRKAMEKATSEGGQFYKGMEVASQTVSGLTSTLKDNAAALMGDLSTGVFEELKNTFLPMAIAGVDEIQTALTEGGITAAIGAAGNVLGKFITYIIDSIPTLIETANELLMSLASALSENSEGIAMAAMSIVGGLATAFMDLAPILLDMLLDLLVIMAEYLSENADVIGEKAGDFVASMINWLTDNLDTIIDIGIQLIGAIITGIATATPDIAASLANLGFVLLDTITGWLEDLRGMVSDEFQWLIDGALNFVDGIRTAFQGLVDFVAGIFAGDWERAWEGIIGIFSGIWDMLVEIVKAPVNGIIALINGVISGINSISIDIPDWVPWYGGSTFGLNIPKIPYLATGAVIPPNAPFMAVLGDQRRGTNIEAPLSTIQQALRDVMAERGNGDPMILRVFLDSRVVYESMVDRNRENTIATGQNAFTGG